MPGALLLRIDEGLCQGVIFLQAPQPDQVIVVIRDINPLIEFVQS